MLTAQGDYITRGSPSQPQWCQLFVPKDAELLIGMDHETYNLLTKFAGQNSQSLEQAACSWLELQASECKQNKELERCWTLLTDREQSVVALCCLAYSDREIATHLYNAIAKFSINKKSELLILLRNWDFKGRDG